MGYLKAVLLPHINESNLQSVKIEYRYGSSSKDRPRFKTGYYSTRKDWDIRNGRSKNDDALNYKLEEIKSEINKVKNILVLKGLEPSGPAVKKAYEEKLHDKKNLSEQIEVKGKRDNKTVTAWYKEFLTAISKPTYGLKQGTINNRNQFYEILKAYNKKATLLELTKNYLDGLLDYMLTKEYSTSTIGKHFSSLSAMIKWILSFEENEDIPIPSAYKKVRVNVTYNDPIGLTVSEFLKLYDSDLSHDKDLELSRDWFVLGVSMGGLRISDLFGLTFNDLHKDDTGNYYISYVEQKTSRKHQNMPISLFGANILEKYNGLMPHQNEETFRRNLKSIADYLVLDRSYEHHTFDIKGKILRTEKKILKDAISSKFMRKTKVSIDAHIGVPIQVSMSSTGHKTFKSYARYMDINHESIVDANKKWNKLLGK